jgi:hypothetical protein
MSTVTSDKLQEGQEHQERAAAPATPEGLIELGAVSETKGGLLGPYEDIGNGYSFGF